MSTGRIVTIVLFLIIAVGLMQMIDGIGLDQSDASSEHEAPPVDLYVRAACAAIATPVGDALDIDLTESHLWLHDVADDSLAACRLYGTGTAGSPAAVTDVVHAFFRYAGWLPYSLFDADAPRGTTRAYRKSPVTCRYRAEWANTNTAPAVDYTLTVDCFPDVE